MSQASRFRRHCREVRDAIFSRCSVGEPVVHAKHFLSNIGAACILPASAIAPENSWPGTAPVRFSPDLLWEVGAMHLGIKEKDDIIEGIVKGGRAEQRIVVREELAMAESTGFRMIVDGQSRPLNPLIVYRIGRESGMPAAIPAPLMVELEINYGENDLRLAVRDTTIPGHIAFPRPPSGHTWRWLRWRLWRRPKTGEHMEKDVGDVQPR
jgi:hypothetical protein